MCQDGYSNKVQRTLGNQAINKLLLLNVCPEEGKSASEGFPTLQRQVINQMQCQGLTQKTEACEVCLEL